MATVAAVLNRINPNPRGTARWMTGAVTVVNGRKVSVLVDNSSATISGLALDPTPSVGARVLLVATNSGNFILGRIG